MITNLYYFNARYYDATIGRFVNVDPVQDGTNWYVYCSNNPLMFSDPTGLATWIDRYGNVQNVTDDDDLSIYQWQGEGVYDGFEGPLQEGVVVDIENSWLSVGKHSFGMLL